MKKSILILELLLLVFLIGCANKSYYHPATESFASGKLWTGLILIIELIIGLALIAKTSAFDFSQLFGRVIGSAIIAFLMGYIILGEWGLRIFEWFTSSTIGTVLVVSANIFGGILAIKIGAFVQRKSDAVGAVSAFPYLGIFTLFNGTVSIWVLNTFHWHSPEVIKYALIPALIGGVIILILLAKFYD